MNNNTAGGLGILEVLGIIFLVLKLCGIIKWSWIWVLSPFWISLCLIIILIIIVIVIELLN